MTLMLVPMDGKGRSVEVRGPRFVIGRETTCDFIVDHALVSAEHACIVEREGRYYLFDLGSTNGTRLVHGEARQQGRPLRPAPVAKDPEEIGDEACTEDAELLDGTIVGLGLLLMVCRIGGEPTSSPSPPQAVQAHILFTSGPKRGQRIELPADGLVIGSDASRCSITIEGVKTVSRTHARIAPAGGGRWRISDEDSKNGTFVDGRRVATPVVLRGGERISLAKEVEFTFACPAGPGEPTCTRVIAVAVGAGAAVLLGVCLFVRDRGNEQPALNPPPAATNQAMHADPPVTLGTSDVVRTTDVVSTSFQAPTRPSAAETVERVNRDLSGPGGWRATSLAEMDAELQALSANDMKHSIGQARTRIRMRLTSIAHTEEAFGAFAAGDTLRARDLLEKALAAEAGNSEASNACMVLAAFAVATNRLGDPLVLTSPGIARAGETLKDLNARHKGGGRWEAMLRTNVASLALPLAGRLEREASELFQQGEILRGLRRTRDGLSLVECHAGLLSLVQRMEATGRSELARLRDKAYRQEHSADDAARAEAKQIYRETIAVCSSNDWTREFLENAVRRMGP